MKLFAFIFTILCALASAPAFSQSQALDQLIIKSSISKFVFSPAFTTGQHFLSIAPNGGGSANNWNFTRELRLDGSGELIKKVTNLGDRALSVMQNETRNFQVMGDGTVYAREVNIKLGAFPDYVFESDYNRLTLNELKQFIHTNKHLPNIPSAIKVAEDGADIGELTRLQMEKIEELTLYIIELHERITNLEQKVGQKVE